MEIKKLAASAALFCSPFTTFAGDFLSGEQITTTFSGKTVVWEHLLKDKSGKSYYAEDGTLIGIKNGSKREGTWHVEGKKLCVSWGKCLKIESDGNGGFFKVKGGATQVVYISSVSDGNTLE